MCGYLKVGLQEATRTFTVQVIGQCHLPATEFGLMAIGHIAMVVITGLAATGIN